MKFKENLERVCGAVSEVGRLPVKSTVIAGKSFRSSKIPSASSTSCQPFLAEGLPSTRTLLSVERVKPSKNLTLAGFVASLQNLTEVVSHLSFHVLLLAL